MDFGFNGNQSVNSNSTISDDEKEKNSAVTDLDNNNIDNSNNGNPSTDLDKDNPEDKEPKVENNPEKKEEEETKPLEEGTVIEVDNNKYTVDSNGNLLDDKGNIFKEANDVDAWIKSFEKVEEDTDNEISIANIQKALGVDIVGEDDKPIEFENSIEGIKAYVQAVNETQREENYETAINTLYQKYPIVKDVLDYYVANGNSLEGFNEIPDRSNITVDESNEAQQEEIIRIAWNEKGIAGDVNNYIQYLKSSGTLFGTAQSELEDLKKMDAEYKENLEKQAAEQEARNVEELREYWTGVHKVIESRTIAGYQIPDSIIINKDGQRLSVTPEDFFNYMYRVDNEGHSAYERDLMASNPKSRLEDEILRAYLQFTGGSYSNLVDMAINKKTVNTLRLKAKENKTSTVRINRLKPNNETKKIDFGYN